MDFNSFKAKAKVLDLASMRGIVGGSGTCAFITRNGFVFAGVSKSEAISYAGAVIVATRHLGYNRNRPKYLAHQT